MVTVSLYVFFQFVFLHISLICLLLGFLFYKVEQMEIKESIFPKKIKEEGKEVFFRLVDTTEVFIDQIKDAVLIRGTVADFKNVRDEIKNIGFISEQSQTFLTILYLYEEYSVNYEEDKFFYNRVIDIKTRLEDISSHYKHYSKELSQLPSWVNGLLKIS